MKGSVRNQALKTDVDMPNLKALMSDTIARKVLFKRIEISLLLTAVRFLVVG